MGSFSTDIPETNGTAFSLNPLDPTEFRRHGHMIIDFLADYYENVHKYPVRTYFPSSGSTAGFLGEMLSTGINAVCFNWMSSPAATELETIVTDWLGKLLKLPESFLFSGGGGGVLQGTTCEAILCVLTAQRDKVLKRVGKDQINRLVVYGSDQTHSALQKAAQVAGINPANFRVVKTYKSDSFCLTPESLQQQVDIDVEAGLIPLFLCATVGTTSSTAVDQLPGLCEVAAEHEMWVHVDAAYAGSAYICPEFRHFIDGIEGASSFSFNAHKWFFINLDCCCLWVKEPQALINALSTNPEFLRNKATESKQVVDYKDWQIALSRRFRAMKLWMVLRSYGVAMMMDERFEVVVPRNFAMVCFRLNPKGYTLEEVNGLNSKMLEAINGSGKLYMSHTVLGDVYVIRFAVGATLTEVKHVKSAWKVLQEYADGVWNGAEK